MSHLSLQLSVGRWTLNVGRFLVFSLVVASFPSQTPAQSSTWLRLIARAGLISEKRVRLLLVATEELIKIFATSVRTAEKNAR